jgi:predicted RNA binding protein YcfA (HicA-like mRNA interferase family)
MRTNDVLAMLQRHGWKIHSDKGSHKMLVKGKEKRAFAVHGKDMSPTMVKALARRFEIPFDKFFSFAEPVKVLPLKVVKLDDPIGKPSITTGPMTGGSKLVFLPVGTLEVDHRYQRPLNMAWARQIADKWDDRLMGILTVSERDGAFWLLEGQHRVAALGLRGEANRKVPCLAFSNLDLEEEADIYLGRNNVKLSTTLALFHAKLAAGDTAASEIFRVVTERHGIRIGATGKTSMNSIGALNRLYGWGTLSSTFSVWRAAWGDKDDAATRLRSPILLAMGAMIAYYGKLLDHTRLASQLRPFTAPELMHMAMGRFAGKQSSQHEGTYVILVDVFRSIYNHRMKGNSLPAPDINPSVISKWGLLKG